MRIGFVGLGTMGAAMARNLLEAGFDVAVHNRTRTREEPLAEAGATRADDPAAAAAGAAVVVTMVSDTADTEEVLLGPRGVVEGAAAGSVVVDMSTIDPHATRAIGARLAASGIRMVDAPVSGGSEGAQAGTLTIMAGGSPEDLTEVRPVLEALGTVTHVGPIGAGQATKAVNQVVVGGMYLAVAEGIALGKAAGLDMDLVLEAIGRGACRSWVLEHRGTNMLRDSYPLGFRLWMHRKDLRIALRMASEFGVKLPLSDLVASIEDRLVDEGAGDLDVSALFRGL